MVTNTYESQSMTSSATEIGAQSIESQPSSSLDGAPAGSVTQSTLSLILPITDGFSVVTSSLTEISAAIPTPELTTLVETAASSTTTPFIETLQLASTQIVPSTSVSITEVQITTSSNSSPETQQIASFISIVAGPSTGTEQPRIPTAFIPPISSLISVAINTSIETQGTMSATSSTFESTIYAIPANNPALPTSTPPETLSIIPPTPSTDDSLTGIATNPLFTSSTQSPEGIPTLPVSVSVSEILPQSSQGSSTSNSFHLSASAPATSILNSPEPLSTTSNSISSSLTQSSSTSMSSQSASSTPLSDIINTSSVAQVIMTPQPSSILNSISTSTVQASKDSSLTPTPSAIPDDLQRFVIRLTSTLAKRKKRQAQERYAVVGADGVVSLVLDCPEASFFVLADNDTRLTYNGLAAYANADAITSGLGPFKFGVMGSDHAETGFTIMDSMLHWSNPRFGDINATFAVNQLTNKVEVIYNGLPPSYYELSGLDILFGESLNDGKFNLCFT
jgi:hypothetical protein